MTSKLSFSIIIANYNYARFIRRAIDSALVMRGHDVQVVVVDDGSSDNSRDVIREYGNQIVAIFKENGGQRSANNAGYAISTGDIIIFLDADDVLETSIADEIAAVWEPGVSKVQFQMARVDEHERPLGSIIPQFHNLPKPRDIRRWLLQTGEYPSPPGSGNAYARTFLEQIFPLGDDKDSFTDSSCVAMAPVFGQVISIAKPLVLYRIHGSNDSNMLARPDVFAREIVRARKRLAAVQEACAMTDVDAPDEASLFRGKHLLQLRVASIRISAKQHPLPGDNRLRAIGDALAAPFRPDFEPLSRRLMIGGWSLLTLIAPATLSRKLIAWRFANNS